MNIQWYPGHMAKSKRALKDSLNLIDIIIEILDARIPYSSKNPDIDKLAGDKPVILVLNKTDLADKSSTYIWKEYYESRGYSAVPLSLKTGEGFARLKSNIKNTAENILAKRQQKGILKKQIKLMAAGIPNSGKSTFINKMGKKSKAAAANRPGVTRINQWIKTGKEFMLLDTPGLLWPKFENKSTGLNLAFTGAVKDDIIDIAELAFELITILKGKYKNLLEERYNIKINDDNNTINIINNIALKRGCIISGGEIDYNRVSALIIDDFRNAKTGRITLELPDDIDMKR